MPLLFLLSCWWYGGDVAALGHTSYPVRSAAHVRLASASWLAYPALLTGGPNAESAERCGLLLEALPSLTDVIGRQAWRAVVRMVDDDEQVPELSPGCWLLLKPAVCRAASIEGVVWVTHPRTGMKTGISSDYAAWCGRECYYTGSHAGDVRLMCESVRQQRSDTRSGR